MATKGPTLEELAARVERLERRLAAGNGGGGEGGVADTASSGADTASAPLDAERFWALDGLRTRAQGASQVLFTGDVRLPPGETAAWQQGFDVEALLDADWTLGADVLAALGQPVRLTLLREILRGTRTASKLQEIEGLGTSGQIYHHLRQLVAAGWLRSAGRGQFEVPATRIVALLIVIAAAQR
ncbi:MAG: ArsR family transcriptional regulator [Actinocatenispora sp.]